MTPGYASPRTLMTTLIVWRLDVPALVPCHAFYTVHPVSPVIRAHRIVVFVSPLAPRLKMSYLAPLPVTVTVDGCDVTISVHASSLCPMQYAQFFTSSVRY